MDRASVERELARLRERVFPLARFAHALTLHLGEPRFIRNESQQGFRFDAPDLRHFCLLRACRIVSALNASLELARGGYPQEIGVILRTLVEYSTQIDFVLANRDSSGLPIGDAALFISDFFADDQRGTSSSRSKARLVQKKVHDAIGSRLDKLTAALSKDRPTTDLLSSVYLVFTNYVHGKYPESMDLFGGRPGRFHLYGMSDTPKDRENLETLDSFITSASNCLVGMVQELKLHHLLQSDPMLANWYNEAVSGGES